MKYTLTIPQERRPVNPHVRDLIAFVRLNADESRMLDVLTESADVDRAKLLRFLITNTYEQLTQSKVA